MSKRAFDKIKAGLDDALAFAEGRAERARYRVHVPDSADVRAIRSKLGLSQAAFAARFGFTAAAVREWEYGRRQPERSARVLLAVIASEPEAVDRALRQAADAVDTPPRPAKRTRLHSSAATARA